MAVHIRKIAPGSLASKHSSAAPAQSILWFDQAESSDVSRVGGKNAGLAEVTRALTSAGIRVPPGFAVTAAAYRAYIESNALAPKMRKQLDDYHGGKESLAAAGAAIRRLMIDAEFPAPIAESIRAAYRELAKRCGTPDLAVAVRSSATAEDLPQASFAGQQETYLNVRGESELLRACRKCYASLFTDRAIVYRETNGFDHLQVALSIGIQKMVRADRAGSGVMFTLDTETGFPGVVVVNAAWGLGENVVQGTVNPDKYVMFKQLLADEQSAPDHREVARRQREKARLCRRRQRPHAQYQHDAPRTRSDGAERCGNPAARPLGAWPSRSTTVIPWIWSGPRMARRTSCFSCRRARRRCSRPGPPLRSRSYSLNKKGKPIVTGAAIGEAIASGNACLIHSAKDIDRFRDGSILVTESTDPDWVPIMKKAAGLITNYGGTTSHAAIVSRELGLPAIVGTLRGTELIKDKQPITLCCAEGEQGSVYDGILDFKSNRGRPRRCACHAHRDDGEHRQPGGRLSLVAPAGQGNRARAHGIHHQQHHQDPSDGAGAFRGLEGSGRTPPDRGPDPGLCHERGILRRHPGARHRQDRRPALSAIPSSSD